MYRALLASPRHRLVAASAAGVGATAFLSSSRGGPAEATPRTTRGTVRPVVVCGPSGVGKGTLINMLLEEFGDKVGFSVSHTTRAPRPGEVNGTHYHFASMEVMEKMIADGEFVEYARVHGNIYGTSKKAVNAVASQGKVCVLDIDVQGAKSVSNADIDAFFMFVLPPSVEELERRLRGRGTESEKAIQKRLFNATSELAQTDLPFWDAKITNEDKEQTYQQVRALILEHCM
jgi:guanylate kinase